MYKNKGAIDINIAVIGAGYWGPNVIRNFHKSNKANLKYVCDISSDNLEKISLTKP